MMTSYRTGHVVGRGPVRAVGLSVTGGPVNTLSYRRLLEIEVLVDDSAAVLRKLFYHTLLYSVLVLVCRL